MLVAGFELPEFEWVDTERELVLRGTGGTSSGVWLNLLTRSLRDVCRFRGVLESVGLDFAEVERNCSFDLVEAYLEACGV